MKLSTAFDSMSKENQFLKLLAKAQLVTTVFLLGLIYNFSDRVPVMVERSSHGLEVLRVTPFERSQADLKLAVGLMIRARFDSNAISPELFLNPKQILLRDTEQRDMKARGMTQAVVAREIKFEKDQITVDLDRVIAVGEVRSALKARLKVSFEEVSPNELNPYGLLLSFADPIGDKESGK
jgi:hypothetical protein